MAYDIRFNVQQTGAETIDQITAKMTVMKERVKLAGAEIEQAANRVASAEKQMAEAASAGHAKLADSLAGALEKCRAEYDALIAKQTEEKAAIAELNAQMGQVATTASTKMVPAVAAANAEFRLLEGSIPTRAIGQFITNVAGLGSIARGLFPVAGLIAFAAGVVTIGEKIFDLVAKWDAVTQAEKRAKAEAEDYAKSAVALKAKLRADEEEEFERVYGKSAGAAHRATNIELQDVPPEETMAGVLKAQLAEAKQRLAAAQSMPDGGAAGYASYGSQAFANRDAALRQAQADVKTLTEQLGEFQNKIIGLRSGAHRLFVESSVEGKKEETKGERPDLQLAKRTKDSDIELEKQLQEVKARGRGKEFADYAAIHTEIQGIIDAKKAEGILDDKGLRTLQQTEVEMNKNLSQSLLAKLRKRDWRDIVADAKGDAAAQRGDDKLSTYEFQHQLHEDIAQGEKDVAADRAIEKQRADVQDFRVSRSAQQTVRSNRLRVASGEISAVDAAGLNYQAQVSAANQILDIETRRIDIIKDKDVREREMATAQKQAADSLYQAEVQYEESLDELRERNLEKYRHASGDIFSALINRQEGPGRALGLMLRSSIVGQAGQVFENLTSGVIGKISNGLAGIIPAGSPLSKVFRGTSLDPANKDVPQAQIATATNTSKSASLLEKILSRIEGKGTQGGDATTAGQENTGTATAGLKNPLAAIPISLPPEISKVAALASSSRSAISKTFGGLSSGLSTVLGGGALATLLGRSPSTGSGDVNGLPNPMAGLISLPAPTTSQRVGAGLGLAGVAAAGTYGIISGIHQGEAGGDLKAAGSAAGLVGSAVQNVSKLMGVAGPLLKAIPVVGSIAALALPLIGSFFGQGPARRQNQLNQELSANQYIAPQALNVTMDPSGHFADFDARGNLRTSSFSPYPTVRQGMVWEQTHGLFGPPPTYYNVPGGQTSQFGPAAAPQPLIGTLHMNALDTQTGVDFLMKNSHTIASAGAKALQDGHGGFAAEVQRTAAVG